MAREVVITGIGIVTPLGQSPEEVLLRIRQGETAVTRLPFAVGAFSCPYYAPVTGFNAEPYFPENKTLRLMNRDAQMAAVAARLAMEDACLVAGETYPAERIALYGATGMTSLSMEDVSRLIRSSAASDGSPDLKRFGRVALKRTRPVLSFKILANMPICFVSILESIRGPNAVYTPWEGQGAQAIAAGQGLLMEGKVRSHRADMVAFDGRALVGSELIATVTGGLALLVDLDEYHDPDDMRVLFSEIYQPEHA